MDYLCQLCDKEIIEIESEYKNYLATERKKDDKSIYTKNMLIIILIWKKLIK